MVALLAVVVVSVCVGSSRGISTTLPATFAETTSSVSPPALDAGGITKNLTAEAVAAFLRVLQLRLDFAEHNSVKAISQPVTNLFKGVEHSARSLDESAPANLFDGELTGYAQIFRRLAALAKDNSSREVVAGAQQRAPTNTSTKSSLWTPEEAFIEMPDIIAGDLRELHDWLVAFVDAGINAAVKKLPVMLDEYRKSILYPEVKSVQQTASRLEELYGSALQRHSTPDVWSDYVEARKILTAIQLVS